MAPWQMFALCMISSHGVPEALPLCTLRIQMMQQR